MNRFEQIKQVLENKINIVDDTTKSELIQKLSTYHEELYFKMKN